MDNTIAIFGQSCVGKSVIADEMSKTLGYPVRHCGEIIKNRGREIGEKELSQSEHHSIDAETRRIAEGCTSGIIIEGNFLDVVLCGLTDIRFIHLICQDDERKKRQLNRSASSAPFHLQMRDEADALLRKTIYSSNSENISNVLVVDTTHLSVEATVSHIITSLYKGHNDQVLQTAPIPRDDRG